ncbi:uncharacterized protein PGRI_067810 [Penicillium griseofulvum]|uniref:NmrA-like domain-containing protein n=1 Tax=Penicillium patulum TaxID=5078 RepID=A0A135LQM7_PENPA|nr:uncharacterized protein PGRI_067810 [Penicillium griseofulvum]KXG51209.1 hypothetical protein PGRI_067810 [Penicillium griseofulvum]
MSTPGSILVIGAGELGTYVLQALAHHPQRRNNAIISVLLRESSIKATEPSKAARIDSLSKLGITFTPGDVTGDSEDKLSSIFKEFEVVICCTGYMAESGLQVKISRAVIASKVPYYIPWQFGMDYEAIGRGYKQYMFDEQLDVRDFLRSQSTTRWLALSTGLFTSVIFPPIGGLVDVENKLVYGIEDWDNKFSTTTTEDIGKFTAEIVLGPEMDALFVNGPVYVAGDTVSYREVADAIEEATGQKFTRKLLNQKETQHNLQQELTAGNICRNVFAQGRGFLFDSVDLWVPQAGLKTTSFRKFALEFFQGSA